jgi:hypothetical protein
MYFDKKKKVEKGGAMESIVEQILGYSIDGLTLLINTIIIWITGSATNYIDAVKFIVGFATFNTVVFV